MEKSILAQAPIIKIGPYSVEDPLKGRFLNIGDIIGGNKARGVTGLLTYVYILAGLLLFIYLIWGGFELLTSAGNPEGVNKAKGKITQAVIGFVIIFVSYWLIQILEIFFGIRILGV